MGQIPFLPMIG